MRRRPLAVYRVIDEAELLGEREAAPESDRRPRADSSALADDPDAPLAARGRLPARHAITLGVLAFGLLALLAATLISTAPTRHIGLALRVEAVRRAHARARPSELARLAVRVQKRITDGVRRPLWPRARKRGPRRSSPPPHVRAKRPPRVRQRRAAPVAPPAAAPVTARSSPASEFGFER